MGSWAGHQHARDDPFFIDIEKFLLLDDYVDSGEKQLLSERQTFDEIFLGVLYFHKYCLKGTDADVELEVVLALFLLVLLGEVVFTDGLCHKVFDELIHYPDVPLG